MDSFTAGSADWRSQIRKNSRRTAWCIGVFVAFYLGLGLLIDLYYYSSVTHADVATIFQALISFKIVPRFTIITTLIALISLFVTYAFYDKIMLLGTEYRQITPETAQSLAEKQLYNIVEELKIAAGLHFMPKVYLIDADYMNAFASGYSEKSAMVAITRGLFEKLDRSELQAVMAHELSHIRHGDIKLTLTASVLSNILLIAVDLIFFNMIYGRDRKADERLVIVIVILRYLLPIITLLLTLYLSRTREYMADAGCVELMRDNQPLARALIKIHEDTLAHQEEYKEEYKKTPNEDVRKAAYLYDPEESGIKPMVSLANLFSTHPDLQHRLQAIGIKLNQK